MAGFVPSQAYFPAGAEPTFQQLSSWVWCGRASSFLLPPMGGWERRGGIGTCRMPGDPWASLLASQNEPALSASACLSHGACCTEESEMLLVMQMFYNF